MGYPAYAPPVTLPSYHPGVHSLASLGAPLPQVRQHGLAARRRQCGGDRPCGSVLKKPMGEGPLRSLRSSFLLRLVGPSAQSYSALHVIKVLAIG